MEPEKHKGSFSQCGRAICVSVFPHHLDQSYLDELNRRATREAEEAEARLKVERDRIAEIKRIAREEKKSRMAIMSEEQRQEQNRARKIQSEAAAAQARAVARQKHRSNGKKCFYCECSLNEHNFTRDHVIPRSKGGRGAANYVDCCKICNQEKGCETTGWFKGCRK